MERVGRVAAVRPRVGQRADHVEELDERARPAVDEQQRGRVRLGRPDVQEVDRLAVDLGGELRVLVQPASCLAPVVAVDPVGGEALEVVDGDAAGPARRRAAATGQRVRPRRSRRSSSSACGMSMRKGRMSSLMSLSPFGTKRSVPFHSSRTERSIPVVSSPHGQEIPRAVHPVCRDGGGRPHATIR